MGKIMFNGIECATINYGAAPSPSQDYDYYYETFYSDDIIMKEFSLPIPDSDKLFRSGFENYDFELLVNCTPSPTYSSESCIIGMYGNSSTNAAIELYFKDGSAHFMARYIDSNTSSGKQIFNFSGDFSDKDIVMSKRGNAFSISCDGDIVYSSTYNVTSYAGTGRLIRVGNYQGQYYFNGVINKVGFKWLN